MKQKQTNLLAIFDSHTPYLAFRLNALHREIEARGLSDRLHLEIVLIGAEEKSYGWEGEGLQSFYDAKLHVLSDQFRGLGMRSFLHRSVPGCLWRLFKRLIRLRPKVTFVGGYDRPESILTTLLTRLWGGKTGVWNDSKFNDAESYGKSIWIELIKSLMVARYAFYLCPGHDSVEYHRFLGGRKKLALSDSWDVVDNEGIGKAAGDNAHDSEIRETLGLKEEARFFFMPVRFIAKKNVNRVLTAYAAYHKRQGEASLPLVICGKGPLEDAIRRQVDDLQIGAHVNLVPWLAYERVPRACRLSQALILASTHDQWGMIVNEALAAGAPVLVSNRCGAHEVVRNHINGFTFDPYDVEHISALLAIMTQDQPLIDRLRENAAASVESFSIDQWLGNHFAVLEHYGILVPAPNDQSSTSTTDPVAGSNTPDRQPAP